MVIILDGYYLIQFVQGMRKTTSSVKTFGREALQEHFMVTEMLDSELVADFIQRLVEIQLQLTTNQPTSNSTLKNKTSQSRRNDYSLLTTHLNML
jgi:hypothetical protein